MQLSGPPKINDLTLPLPSRGEHMRVEWRNEAQAHEMRSGEIRYRQIRLRGRIRFGYLGLSYETAEALIEELQEVVVEVTPRTERAGDPDVEEVTLPCRLTSDLPTTAELVHEVYPVEIELETIHLYASVRPLVRIEPSVPDEEDGGDGGGDDPPSVIYAIEASGELQGEARIDYAMPDLEEITASEELEGEARIDYEIDP